MITLKVYRSNNTWFCARWINGEYDGCDELDCPDSATSDEALETARTMPLTVDGEREVSLV